MYRKITLTCLALAWLLPARAADHSLADLSFMLGHWQGDPGEGGFEEIWLPEAEGVMTGFFRWPSVRGHYVLELTTITSIDAEIVLRFKHFNPDITTWEEGQALAAHLCVVIGEGAEVLAQQLAVACGVLLVGGCLQFGAGKCRVRLDQASENAFP